MQHVYCIHAVKALIYMCMRTTGLGAPLLTRTMCFKWTWRAAFRSGAVMGFLLAGTGLLVLWLTIHAFWLVRLAGPLLLFLRLVIKDCFFCMLSVAALQL